MLEAYMLTMVSLHLFGAGSAGIAGLLMVLGGIAAGVGIRDPGRRDGGIALDGAPAASGASAPTAARN